MPGVVLGAGNPNVKGSPLRERQSGRQLGGMRGSTGGDGSTEEGHVTQPGGDLEKSSGEETQKLILKVY